MPACADTLHSGAGGLGDIHFPCQTVDFPIRYIGIPLGVSKLPKIAWQPLVDRVGVWLPTWRGRLLHRLGRLTLVKTMMMAIPIHTCIAVGIPP
jgi:hypothetical protein